MNADPKASIRGTCVDAYPITVTIAREDGEVIWRGAQQGLFKKRGWPAREEIENAVRAEAKAKA